MHEKLTNIYSRFRNLLPSQKMAGADVRPTRDWVLLVWGAGALLLGLFAVGAYEYFYGQYALDGADVYTVEDVAFDREEWGGVVGAFRTRTATFNSLRAEPEEFPLPNDRTDMVILVEETDNDVSGEESTETPGGGDEEGEEGIPVLES